MSRGVSPLGVAADKAVGVSSALGCCDPKKVATTLPPGLLPQQSSALEIPVSNPWFRLYTEMVDDEKLRLLAFEDRWHYVAILCCKGKGMLDAEPDHALLIRKVSVKLGLTPRETETMLGRLAEVGLVCASTCQPTGWDNRQFVSDTSTERVRAFRERTKRSGNVTVTAQDTDTDTDTEQKKKDQKPLPSPRGSRLPNDWQLPGSWGTWAAREHPNVDAQDQARRFADFWHSKAGKDATKLDWQKTWQNWIRNAADRSKPNATYRPTSAVERVRANAIAGAAADDARSKRHADLLGSDG